MKDKLEVGMYVRTNKGTIDKIDDKNIMKYEVSLMGFGEKPIKTSHNIIDLIQVGDYVNKLPVEDYYTRYDEEKDDYIKIGIITLEDYWKGTFTSVEDIKSIVTKEMFSSMEYRLGDDK